MDISPNGRFLAAGDWGKTIELWDIPSRKRVAVLEGHAEFVTCVAFDPATGGGMTKLASSSNDGSIKLWDTESGICLLTLDPAAGGASQISFVPAADSSSGAAVLLSRHANGTVFSWELSYYDRHIAGNLAHQLERLTPEDSVRP